MIKWAAAIAVFLGVTAGLHGQGTINFANNSSTAVTNALTGEKVVEGTTFTIALYWAVDGTANDGAFVPLDGLASFDFPGIFSAGTRTSDTPGGQFGMFQVRVWETAYATAVGANTWDNALAAPLLNGRRALAGKSILVRARTGNPTTSPPTVPGNLVVSGLTGFYLTEVSGLPGITCPADITTNLPSGQSNVVVAYAPSGAGSPAPVITCVPPSGTAFVVSTNTVTCTASNVFGTANCSFAVRVQAPASSVPNDFVAHWAFDESSGVLAQDDSVNLFTGVLTNNAVFSSPGRIGGAVSFDGVKARVAVGDADLLEFAGRNFTLALWVKTSRTSAQGIAEKQHSSPGGAFLFVLNRDNAVPGGFSVWTGGDWIDSNWRSATDGQWHHLAVSFDGTSFRLYRDGQLDRTQTQSAPYVGTAFPLNFGRLMTAGINWPFLGLMDDARRYNRALTLAEIGALAGGSTSTNPPTPLTVTNVFTFASVNPTSGVSVGISPNDLAGLGAGSTAFARSFSNGTSVTLTAPAMAGGSDFNRWERGGTIFSSNRIITVTVDTNRTWTAIYTTPPPAVVTRTLTIASTNPASGAGVMVSPADFNGAANGTTLFTRVYTNNSVVTLTAMGTTAGQNFFLWRRDGVAWTNGLTATLTLNEDHTMTAVYVSPDTPMTRTLTIASLNPSTGVVINVNPPDNNALSVGTTLFTRTYDGGDVITLTAPGSVNSNAFVKWQRDGADYSTNVSVMVPVDADRVLTAVYAAPPSTNEPPAGANDYVARWAFDEGSGVLAQDDSTNHFTGVLTNNASFVAGGRINGAVNFDGNASRVTVADTDLLEFAGRNFTLALWVKTSRTSPQAMAEKQHSGPGTFLFAINRDNAVPGGISVWTGGDWIDSSWRGAVDGQWHHVAVSYDGTAFRLYRDGLLDRTVNTGASYVGTTFPLNFGRLLTIGINWPFLGQMDEARRYNRALSTAEIAALAGDTGATNPPAVVTRTLTVNSTNPASGVSITISPADTNGQSSGSTPLSRIYTNNSVVTLTAPATASGNNFSKWQRDGVDHTNGLTALVTLDANRTLTAVYTSLPPAVVTRTLTVNSTNPVSGVNITISPADTNGQAGGSTPLSRTYTNNSVVTLTAPSTASGNNFSKWQRDGVDYTNGLIALVTMDANRTLTAVYTSAAPAVVTRTLTVNSTNPVSGVSITITPADTNGQTSGSTPLSRVYTNGSVVTLTAPSSVSSNAFAKWQRDGVDFSTNVSVMVPVDADRVLTAVYAAPPSTNEPPAGANDYVARWAFDEGSGVLAQDDSTNHFTGVLANNASFVAGGRINGAVNFDGNASRVTVADTDLLEFAGRNFTLALWVKTSRTSAQAIAEKQHSGVGTFLFAINRDNAVPGGISVWTGGDWIDSSWRGAVDGQWHHVAVSYDGTAFRLYRDGLLDRTVNTGASYVGTTFPLNFGRLLTIGINWPFLGQMDEARRYNRALSTAEIAALAGDTGATNPPAVVTRTLTVNSTNPASGVSITISPADTNGQSSGSTPLSRIYTNNSVVTLTAPATASGNNFSKWQRDGVDHTNGLTALVTLDANRTLTAVYTSLPPAVVTRTLTVNSTNPASGVSITISPADTNGQSSGSTPLSRIYTNNSVVTLAAPATASGNNFSKWQRDGVDYTNGLTALVTLDANRTLTAVYTSLPPAVVTRTLTVNSTNPASGVSITISPADTNGQSSGSTPLSRIYTNNTLVTLTAPAIVGTNGFSAWRRDGVTWTNGLTALVILEADRTMTAVYAPTSAPASGLVAWWKLDDGSGLLATDSSGNNLTARLTNGATFTNSGRINGGLFMDGVNDYALLNDQETLDFNNLNFTVALWIRTSRTSAQTLMEKQHTGFGGFFLLALNRDNAVPGGFSVWHGNDWIDSTWRGATDGQWHHLAVTYDGSTFRFYRDGVADRVLVQNATYVNTTLPMNFGRAVTGGIGWFFQGTMDDIQRYSQALTAGEISVLANPPAPAPALVDISVPLPPRFTTILVLGESSVFVSGTATPHQLYRIETSTGLTEWEALGVVESNDEGVFEFLDLTAEGHGTRFYRLMVP